MDIVDYNPITAHTALDSDAISKYRAAGDIVNHVLHTVIAHCIPGASVLNLCHNADLLLEQQIHAIYKSGVEKGIAFPTCISINNCAAHFSPASPEEDILLSVGDIVKIELGAQVDGRIVSAAHTIILNPDPSAPVTGPIADAVCAAYMASEAVLRLLRPGMSSEEIGAVIAKVAENFHCTPVEGFFSSNTKRFVLEGDKALLTNPHSSGFVPSPFTVEQDDVFVIDIAMSTGTGRVLEADFKPTVYRRNLGKFYSLRLKTSKAVLSEISQNFPSLPFSVRNLSHLSGARLGIADCVTHELLIPYPVMFERNGDVIARYKFTALVTSNGTFRLTEFDPPFVNSQYSITDAEILQTLAAPIKKKPKKPERQALVFPTAAESSQGQSAAMDM